MTQKKRRPRRFRWGVSPEGKAVLQIEGKRARAVLAADNGEGDFVGLGTVTAMETHGLWLPISGLPKWAAQHKTEGSKP